MSQAQNRKNRHQLPTMLIMGEGFTEVELLKHLKAQFVPRGAGLALTIDNARGKGAKNVVRTALAKSSVFSFDHVWVLLDTDQDYGECLVSEARRKKIHIAACEPCLEATLLRIKGVEPTGRSQEIKRQFENRFGLTAHDAQLYPRHFDLAVLQSEFCVDSPVGILIQAIRTACMRR